MSRIVPSVDIRGVPIVGADLVILILGTAKTHTLGDITIIRTPSTVATEREKYEQATLPGQNTFIPNSWKSHNTNAIRNCLFVADDHEALTVRVCKGTR